MLTPGHLEVTAHALTAILGAWLGLTVLTRSRTAYARVFGLLALTLALWSTSVIVQRLSTATATGTLMHAVEELAAAVIVPATAHFSLLIATEGHPSRGQRRAVILAYILNVAFAIPGALDRTAPIAISAPQLALGPVPPQLLGWAWIATRVVTLFAAAGWLLQAYRRSPPDAARRRQLGQTLAFVGIGALGGLIRLLSVVTPTDPWIGVSLVTVGMVLSASVVFSAGVFFAPDVADRAFRRSIGVGLGMFVAVGVLLGLDAISRQVLGLDVPLLTVGALIVALAIYEPAVTWWRSRVGSRSPGEVARERLLRIVGEPSLGTATASAGVRPALARVASALDLADAIVLRESAMPASERTSDYPVLPPAIPLVVDDEVFGELRVGPTTSGAPLSPGDEALLRLSAAYVAAALRAGRREDEQVDLLEGLTAERARLQDAAEDLHDALARRTADDDGLRVFALGPLRVERGGETIERWGGEKAGTRQAQGLFAFLFDRGERGLDKDEALELIWPDTMVERADLAFHRTLGGLRHTLDARGDGGKRAVRFRNDRYRLDPAIVHWSDVATFLARLDDARAARSAADRLRLLEEARRLYRGEYLDDCPFYGDSVHVDERRASLRARAVDLLVALGHGYEEIGDPVSAAAAYRDATSVAVDDCPPAIAGLARIAGS